MGGSNGAGLRQALDLLAIGCNVIPSGKPGYDGKKKAPWLEWKQYETVRITADQLRAWDEQYHPTLWGYITGAISGRVEFDTDHPEVKALFDAAGLKPYKRTRKGFHYPFRHPGHHIKTSAGEIMPHLDVRGDGGFINCIGQNEDAEYEMYYLPTEDKLYNLTQLPETVKLAWQKLAEKEARQSRRGSAAATDGRKVPVGERNARLCSLAGTLKNRGLSRDAIFDSLKSAYDRDYEHNPPITDAEIWGIVDQSDKWQVTTPASGRFNRTDLGNAERLIAKYGAQLRYCYERKAWLHYVGTHWQWDNGAAITRLAQLTVRSIYQEGANEDNDDERKKIIDWAKSSESNTKVNAMITQAQALDGVMVKITELDRNPILVNFPNGTLELNTNTLRLHSPDDLITVCLPFDYDPDAKCPKWDTFLAWAMLNDADMVAFLQTMAGYILTGLTKAQVFFFFYGLGANGKTTFTNTLRHLMGEYACMCDSTTLMRDKYASSKGHNEGLANLVGKRLVVASEVGQGQEMAEDVVKTMSGGDSIRASRKHEHEIEYKPTHKLIIFGNHKPVIKDTTLSIWRRIKVVPFEATIPDDKRNDNLEDELKQEWPGIMAWAVRGYREYVRQGLKEPGRIVRATGQYRKDSDLLGEFYEDHCVFEAGAKYPKSEMTADYEAWCYANNQLKLPPREFKARLTERGVTDGRTDKSRFWVGVRKKTPMDDKNDNDDAISEFSFHERNQAEKPENPVSVVIPEANHDNTLENDDAMGGTDGTDNTDEITF